MSTQSQRRYSPRNWISVSYPGIVLAGLLIVTQAVVIAAVNALQVQRDATASSPAYGGFLAGVIIVESLAIVGLWRLYPRLPQWLQNILQLLASFVKSVVTYALAGICGLGYGVLAGTSLWPATVIVGALAAIAWYHDVEGLEWIPHNALAFCLSVVLVTLLGANASPGVIIVFLALTLAWDYTAVSISSIMDDLVGMSLKASLPNFYVIPSSFRINADRLDEWLTDTEDRGDPPEGVASVVGVGDIALPSLLVVAAAVKHGTWTLPTVATIIGSLLAVGALTASLESSESGLPALVWLNPGVIIGYTVGVLATVIL